jgi:xylulokinase
MEIMKSMGMNINLIRAGYANMFLSPIFTQTLANVSGATIELLNTDGAAGAAKAAGIGVGYYKSNDEAFATLTKLKVVGPETSSIAPTEEAYLRWKSLI